MEIVLGYWFLLWFVFCVGFVFCAATAFVLVLLVRVIVKKFWGAKQ